MYATDGQAEGWTDKSNAYCPFPYGRGYNNVTNTEIKPAVVISTLIVMCLRHSNCILHCCRSYSSHQKAARTAKHLTRVTISWCAWLAHRSQFRIQCGRKNWGHFDRLGLRISKGLYHRSKTDMNGQFYWFLPRDAMHKRGLCCRVVSVYCVEPAKDTVVVAMKCE